MLFSEEIASSTRSCSYCSHTIKPGTVCWRQYSYRDWKNICIACIGNVIKGYLDELNEILKRMNIRRVKNEEQKDSDRISTSVSV